MLGPSGCGKTTTLRCIAGLERPDNDDAIWIRGRNMTRVPPRDRNLAFVFQTTAMFPNLSVRRNISFGLDVRKQVPKPEIDRRVADAARMLKIEHLLDRRSHEVSGGQGQRIALGRAIVTEPNAFLLDEPLAALDAALRVDMRTEIKLIQRKLGCTMIFVTHDQEEALTIGDKIAIMKDGVVQQIDTPKGVYHRPGQPLRRQLHRPAARSTASTAGCRHKAATLFSSPTASRCPCRPRSRRRSARRRAPG